MSVNRSSSVLDSGMVFSGRQGRYLPVRCKSLLDSHVIVVAIGSRYTPSRMKVGGHDGPGQTPTPPAGDVGRHHGSAEVSRSSLLSKAERTAGGSRFR